MKKDIISQLHQDLRLARQTRRGSTVKPEDAVRKQHKKYVRMRSILLPESDLITTPFSTILKSRRSYRGKTSPTINLKILSGLLSTLQAQKDGSRPYPSGGALYPVETYIIGNVEGAAPGVFHYNPTEHALEHLWDTPTGYSLGELVDDPVFNSSGSLAIVFTGVWERTACKYGDFSYILTLLEAGHMAQNILLCAAALEIGICPIGGFNDKMVYETLDISENEESPLYVLVL